MRRRSRRPRCRSRPPEAGEQPSHRRVVSQHHVTPAAVAQFGSAPRRLDNVGEEDGRQDAVERRLLLADLDEESASGAASQGCGRWVPGSPPVLICDRDGQVDGAISGASLNGRRPGGPDVVPSADGQRPHGAVLRSIREKCLGRLILFGEHHPIRALDEFTAHYHRERNHQGLGTPGARQQVDRASVLATVWRPRSLP